MPLKEIETFTKTKPFRKLCLLLLTTSHSLSWLNLTLPAAKQRQTPAFSMYTSQNQLLTETKERQKKNGQGYECE